MSIKKKPFVNYTLDEDKKTTNTKVISIRINLEEMKIIENTKEIFNLKEDSKAIKILMKWGYFVIQGKSIADIFKYLFRGNRSKKYDFEDFNI